MHINSFQIDNNYKIINIQHLISYYVLLIIKTRKIITEFVMKLQLIYICVVY